MYREITSLHETGFSQGKTDKSLALVRPSDRGDLCVWGSRLIPPAPVSKQFRPFCSAHVACVFLKVC